VAGVLAGRRPGRAPRLQLCSHARLARTPLTFVFAALLLAGAAAPLSLAVLPASGELPFRPIVERTVEDTAVPNLAPTHALEVAR
jgi:hypothetical protein